MRTSTAVLALALALLISPALPAQQVMPTAFTRGDLAVGAGPSSLVAADFNADGRPDLAVAYEATDTIEVWLGSGDGAFRLHATLPTGRAPRSLHAADLDRNGTIDLVAADSQAETITVLLGIGTGSFQPRAAFAASRSVWPYDTGVLGAPYALAVADFTGDGHADIAVALSGSNWINLLPGAGDGSFPVLLEQAATVFDDPVSLAAGDFTGDGIPDLAAAHLYYLQAIAPGLGTGWFDTYQYAFFQPGPYSVSVAAADLDNNGRLDLVFADNTALGGAALGGDGLTILLGDVNGGFHPRTRYAAGARPVHVVTGEFNGDGHADVAVANSGSDTVTLLHGDGFGAFGAPVHLATGADPAALAAADFNQDGIMDLAVANRGDGTISILLSGSPPCRPGGDPPAIHQATPMPASLWPPSGRLEPVVIGVRATSACAVSTCRIESVYGTDAGPVPPGDWRITGDLALRVRATRSGAGAGRGYHITIACTDEAGNTSRRTATVVVPHDRRGR